MQSFLDINGLSHFLSKLKLLLDGKVDAETGKGLSQNDYTDADKTKLGGIEAGANNYNLPIATASDLGGIKVGEGLSIDASGVLSVTAIPVSYTDNPAGGQTVVIG